MSLFDDVRHGLRTLRRHRSFAALTIATLALGIGANTALFSVVNAVLLQPLPYDHPERVAVVWRSATTGGEEPHSAPDFLDLQRETRSFESIAAHRGSTFDLLGGGGEPVRLTGREVTNGFFDVFGVEAARGRVFSGHADKAGDRLAVLSHGAFQRVFGGDGAVVGRALRLGPHPTVVVGVMPEGFVWPAGADIWVLADRAVPSPPIEVSDEELWKERSLNFIEVVARLRPDVTRKQAQDDVDTLGRRLAVAHPRANAGRGYRVVPIHEQTTGKVRASLLTLLGVVGLLLLIAAANVANLFLARGQHRQRELAMRASLGASPARLSRQLLAESVVLGLCGGVLGLALADAATRLLVRLVPGDLPRAENVGVDGWVLLFTLAVSVGSGLLFGVLPALQAARTSPLAAMGGAGRFASTPLGRLRPALAAGQIALAVVVLAGAGLLLRSFARLTRVDPGFLTTTVLTASVPLPASRYPGPVEQGRFYGQLVERLGQSGRLVAAGFPAPFGSGVASAAPVRRENQASSDAEGMTLLATVTPAYFRVLGIPLESGREFSDGDTAEAPRVVIASRVMAERFWPGQDPLGQRVTLGSPEAFTVVGVVGDVRRKDLKTPAEPVVYLHYRQFVLPSFQVFARGDGPSPFAADLAAAMRALDPALPPSSVETVEALRSRSLAEPRFRTALLGLFAALGLALAAIGLYGVVGESALRRRREIGIRMALGAQRSQVLGLVLRDGLCLSLAGWAAGLLAALALGRLLATFLFGVDSHDPLTLALVSVALLAVATLASYLPARRASRADPAHVMKAE